MTVTKLFPSGAIEVCDIVNGHLMRRTYFGCNKKEAVSDFRKEKKKEKKP